MIEVEEALAKMQESWHIQQKSEMVPLVDAVGRVLVGDIKAPISVPNFPRSAMDGFAVRSADIAAAEPDSPVSLTLCETLFAGDDATSVQAHPHTTIRIMTGAAIPSGFDAVVKQELVSVENGNVIFEAPAEAGENYIAIGEDVKKGETVFPAFSRLNSDSLAILASLGVQQVEVFSKIRVGLIATGNELIAPGNELKAGQIFSSTQYALNSYISRYGGDVVFSEICHDNEKEFCELIKKSPQADLIITTGGVSVGEKDFIPEALDNLGAESLFHFVNMKPGTPLMAARWNDSLILACSGTPFASLANFHLFYWSLLAHFLQCDAFKLKKVRAVIENGFVPARRIRSFIRSYYQGTISIPEIKHRASVLFTGLESNCLLEVSKGESVRAGDTATAYLLPL